MHRSGRTRRPARRWADRPWYTEGAAIIYRQQKEYAAEIAVLERFEKASPRRYRGAFRVRIAKASVLRAAKG